MLIVGAGGLAKEVLQVLTAEQKYEGPIALFDEWTSSDMLFRYPILHSEEQVKEWFEKHSPLFSIGVGAPKHREALFKRFVGLGGVLCSVISPKANVGEWDVLIKEGTIIMTGASLTASLCVGLGTLVNIHATVAHDCKIGDFVEISPGAHISGHCVVEKGTSIGTNASLIPGVSVGEGCVIGAGAVVTKDIPSYSVAVGVPARVIKEIK